MIIYGKKLLRHEPHATTELLVDLCSGMLGRKSVAPLSESNSAKGTTGSSGPAMLSYLGYNRVQGLFTGENQNLTPNSAATPNMATIGPDSGTSDGQTIGNDERGYRVEDAEGPNTDGATQNIGPSYTPPSPQRFFAHFVGHHDLFIHFLESVALNLWNQKANPDLPTRTMPLSLRDAQKSPLDNPAIMIQRAVWNTLLELYLTSIKSSDPTSLKTAQGKALGLLAQSDSLPYDPMHALILCSTSGFTDGLVGLWESMGMYEDVIRFHMEKDRLPSKGVYANDEGSRSPSDEVLRYLDFYGPTNLHLYPLVLRYLTSSPDILSRHPTQLGKLLDTIDAEHIMPPLAVIQLLSRNGVASVGSVKEWLRAKVTETRQDVEADRSLVQSYRTESEAKQKEFSDLANPRQPEVFQVTRCAACGGQLDLPSVHFMCKHSYHQR